MAIPPGLTLPTALGALLEGGRWTRSEVGEAGADVFRIDQPHGGSLYLKHGQGAVAADVLDEGARLAWAQGRLPVPRLVQLVAEAEAAWLLTSALSGRTGDEVLEEDPGQLDMVIAGAAALLRKLHALPPADCPFDAGADVRLAAARRLVEAELVDEDDFADDHQGWSAERMLAEAMRLKPAASERVVTHGDFSLGNILYEDGQATGLIDLGRVGVADPYQDLAILWENLAEFGPDAQAAFLRAYGVDAPDERRLMFHRCLDEMF